MLKKLITTMNTSHLFLSALCAVTLALLVGCGPSVNDGAAAEATDRSADSSFAELFGSELVDARGDAVSVSALDGKTVALYFSAHWCPPCRMFTPHLVDAYNELAAQNKMFEIVFVSSDRSEEAMYAYMEEYDMDWLAVPFPDGNRREALALRYQVRGIPTLIVVDKDGQLITADGRSHIMSQGAAAYEQWLKR